jgi:anthranilate synthase component 1
LLLKNNQLTLKSHYASSKQSANFPLISNEFFSSLDQWWRQEKADTQVANDLPFSGGWFVFLSYELAGQIESGLQLPGNTHCEPTAFATRIPAAIIKDRINQCLYAVTEAGDGHRMETILADVKQVEHRQTGEADFYPDTITVREEEPAKYLSGVQRIKNYIRDGDVFQVNLSRWWNIHFTPAPSSSWLYRQLRTHNPSPFFGLANFDDSAVISSSPERLVKVKNRQVSTRPIAGTRPRGEQARQDLDLREELIKHPKERAEHIMLIDLERNDLGRICQPGSIKVDELMTLETYAHVHHIVSNVTGKLREDVTPGQVIRAVFPGGTITGCPKVRCMEIIAELEQTGRGAYTGSMGYINLNGDMDFNILIRSMVQCKNTVHLRAGAGIVADSIAEKELAETRAKAKGLLKSLGIKQSS